MKKLLSVISLILAFVMITSTFPLNVFASEIAGNEVTNEATAQSVETNTYVVNGYKENVSADGTIGADEYSTTANLAISGVSGGPRFSALRTTEYSEDELKYVSESMSMSFAHDADKIYIGVLDKSGTGTVRNGYSIRLGFDENHPENIVAFYLQCAFKLFNYLISDKSFLPSSIIFSPVPRFHLELLPS